MLLDQVIFQNKSFQFRVGYNIFKTGNQSHHLVDLRSPPDIFPKIGSDAIMQIDRFSDVNNIVVCIMHDIDTRAMRKLFQFLLKIKHLFSPYK